VRTEAQLKKRSSLASKDTLLAMSHYALLKQRIALVSKPTLTMILLVRLNEKRQIRHLLTSICMSSFQLTEVKVDGFMMEM
jgi:hypothetical protein